MTDIPVNRRTAMKTIGAGLAGTALLGTASAKSTTPWGTGLEYEAGENAGGFESFAVTTRSGKLKTMGVSFPDDIFGGLPRGIPFGPFWNLDLPSASGSNFTYAGINWNPLGHDPDGVWTIPHFDFHFYFAPEADVMQIGFVGGVPTVLPATYSIPSEMMPEGYADETTLGFPIRPVIPAMGEHLVDASNLPASAAPPHTYIYGVYDFDGDGVGELHFGEPMITEAFFQNMADGDKVLREVGLPQVFPEAGYYPTAYGIMYDDGVYYVTIENFEWFDAYSP